MKHSLAILSFLFLIIFMFPATAQETAKANKGEGDLLFFTSNRSKRKVAHVGIYLKNGKFIHASTSKGVIVSSLNEQYYTQYRLRGGRVK